MSDTPPETDRLVAYRLAQVEGAVKDFGERFDKKLDVMIGRFVSNDVYNSDKQAAAAALVRAEARIRDLEQEAGEREKQGRTTRLSIALACVTGLIGVAGLIAQFIQ